MDLKKSNNKFLALITIIIIIAAIALSIQQKFFKDAEPKEQTNNQNNIINEQKLSETKDDLIKLYSPLKEQTIESPLVIRGEARGTWFFEGSFPIILTDWDGRIIAQTVAKAEGDWMTENYVPFSAELDFKADTTVSKRGSLILKKDNPSGLPQNDNALEITIFFSK